MHAVQVCFIMFRDSLFSPNLFDHGGFQKPGCTFSYYCGYSTTACDYDCSKRDLRPSGFMFRSSILPMICRFSTFQHMTAVLRFPMVEFTTVLHSPRARYWALACNEKGYLSISPNRDGIGRLNVDWDTIIPSGGYYYHLDTETSDLLYPICQDFSCWEFPHQRLPSAWESKPADYNNVWPTDWNEISYKVKAEGISCCASGSLDSLTIACIVPQTRDSEDWVCNSLCVRLLLICPIVSCLKTRWKHTCLETNPSKMTSVTSLPFGVIYILANLIKEDSLLYQNLVNLSFIFFGPQGRVPNYTTMFDLITRAPCLMNFSMLVSHGG